jgi:NADH dehydrogenase
VTLVSAEALVPSMGTAARKAIRRSLRRLGVSVLERTELVEVEDGYALTSDGGKLEHDVCVVAASFDVPELATVSGLDVDARGRLLVDDSLRSLTCPAILGAGDAVSVVGAAGAHLRMACSTAVPMGGHVAGVLLAALRGTEPAPFDMGFSAQCVSLGRSRGFIQLVNADDSPRRLHVGGALGARIKESVCRRVLEAPVAESTRPGTYTWRAGHR